MHLNLSEDEARTLQTLLRDYLPQLRLEVARTEAREFRHEMVKRQEVCERIIGALERRAADLPDLSAREGL